MSRVEVTDPASGAVLNVDSGSVQARLWGVPESASAVEPVPESKAEPVKRKPGRSKKS